MIAVRRFLFQILFLSLLSITLHGTAQADTDLPKVLNSKDIATYRHIFVLQEEGKWREADRAIKRLESDILMGHILFQRYMHPTKYRSKYNELASWMKRYSDHPTAWRVYKLAKRRQGKARAPRRPVATRYPGVTGQAALKAPPTPNRNRATTKEIATFKANIRKNLRRGRLSRSEKYYWAMQRRNILTSHEQAEALYQIARYYFYEGKDVKAQSYSERGISYSGKTVPSLYWIAAMTHWRHGNIDAAKVQFLALSNAERADDWLISGSHFWAARAALRQKNPDEASEHLIKAAAYKESFYGLIASRQLGIKLEIDWTIPPLKTEHITRLLTYPAAKRAIALSQIGQSNLADEEIRLLWGREGVSVQDDITALAAKLNLPAIQLRLSRASGTGNPAPAALRYPLPDWSPAGGFTVDRAFIFASIHQESSFQLRAKSGPGARGLMQITPATARVISRGKPLLSKNHKKLYIPKYNLALGQHYIDYLRESQFVGGNLFMLLSAYNAGPGNLIRWKREINYHNDPLLFIETIPFRETRNHIEIVMANLWLYRMRLGQPTPSLDVLAEGGWPTLARLDPDSDTVIAAMALAAGK